jgi:Xaa-Pro aminopeptidase
MLGLKRIQMTQSKLYEQGLDALFITIGANVLAFFGYWPGNHAAAGIIPTHGKPILLVPQTEFVEAKGYINQSIVDLREYEFESIFELRSAVDAMLAHELPKAFNDLGLDKSKIGVELTYEDGATGKLVGDYKFSSSVTWGKLNVGLKNVVFIDATSMIRELRSIKTPDEIELISKTIRIAEQGLSLIYSDLWPGMSEAKVSSMIEANVITNTEGNFSRAFTATYSGPRSAEQWVHYAYSSHRIIQENELVIVELGCVSDGYWCDLTRCAVSGQPSQKTEEIFKIVREAQEKGLKAAKIGEPLSVVNNACYELFKRYGYGDKYFRHSCGHGTGFNYHEGPPIHMASNDLIQEGMVLCIEPGLYFSGEFGIRVEDVFVVTKSGARRLSKHPDKLSLR